MMTTEDFTDRSRRILTSAQEYACAWCSAGVDTGHLLLALLYSDRNCVPLTALSNLKIDIDALSMSVEKAAKGRDETMIPEGTIPGHTPQLLDVLSRARKEAKVLGHSHVGAEHLMLGLLLQKGSVAHVILVGLDVPTKKIINEILDLLGATGSSTPLHRCEFKANPRHRLCIDICSEESDGTLWATNGDVRSRVNFCPVCGYQAKLRADALIPYPADAPADKSAWKHFKGDDIPVHFMARHSETKEPLVIYDHLGERWARPLSMWHEEPLPGIRRFTLIGEKSL